MTEPASAVKVGMAAAMADDGEEGWPPLEIRYELGLRDYAAFSVLHATLDPQVQRAWTAVRLGMPLIWVAAALVASDGMLRWGPGLILIAVCLAWIALQPRLSRASLFRRSLAAARQRLHPGQLGPHTLRIDAEGMTRTNDHSRAVFPWHTLARVEEDAERLYLFVGPSAAIVVPKSGLSTEVQDELRRLESTWACL